MRAIVLVGFMGTGKTVVGRRLAKKLQYAYVDTDDLIVQQAGKPITRIFAEDGEDVFRTRETEALQTLVNRSDEKLVVSTGGGIVIQERNWPLLRALGRVVCLTAKPDTIIKRVGSAKERPLLAGTPEEVKKRIDALLAQRQEAYARADWLCETDNQSPHTIVEKIMQWSEANASKKG